MSNINDYKLISVLNENANRAQFEQMLTFADPESNMSNENIYHYVMDRIGKENWGSVIDYLDDQGFDKAANMLRTHASEAKFGG